MKKNVKLVSALLILVMIMAQVVCVSAATNPKPSTSFKQVDHYEKEFTATFSKPDDIAKIHVAAYNANGGVIEKEEINSVADGLNSIAVTMSVRPSECQYVRVWVQYEDGTKYQQDYTVGGNSYYNPGSSSSSSSTGSYDGLVSSGSSNSYWTGSSSGSTNVYDYYDPNKWYGYYEDKEDYEVKAYDYYYVTCRTLNVRNGAGTWADKVGSLKRYTKVKVYDIEGGWAVIEYKGRLRYVSARYIDEY